MVGNARPFKWNNWYGSQSNTNGRLDGTGLICLYQGLINLTEIFVWFDQQ